MTLVKLIIIVFLSLKSPHIWIDVRVCVCSSAQPRRGGAGGNEGPGGTEAGQVGTPEAELSGFEAGRCVLPRRARWASIERFIACPGSLFCRPSPRQSCDVSKTINIITYTDV